MQRTPMWRHTFDEPLHKHRRASVSQAIYATHHLSPCIHQPGNIQKCQCVLRRVTHDGGASGFRRREPGTLPSSPLVYPMASASSGSAVTSRYEKKFLNKHK